MSQIRNNNPLQSLIKEAESTIIDRNRTQIPKAGASIKDTNSPFTGHSNTDFLIERLNKLKAVSELIPKGKSLAALSEKELFYLLENLTQAAMVIKENLTNSGSNNDKKKGTEKLLLHSKIKVGSLENAILIVTLPPLVGQKYKGSYDIYWDVKRAIENYLLTHELPSLTNKKLLLIYKKYAPNLSIDYTCDNDNWESKRTTNAIAESINHSDNAEHFSMMYTAIKHEKCFVEALIIEAKNLRLFTDYIICEAPIQPI